MRNRGIQEYRNRRIEEYRNTGIHEQRNTGIQKVDVDNVFAFVAKTSFIVIQNPEDKRQKTGDSINAVRSEPTI